jgi:protein-tyrosine phosphatase
VIDLHCHLLPGLDDGPASLAESVEMARGAVDSGTSVMVATPHIDHHWGVAPAEVPRRAALLSEALRSDGIELEVLTGGEIALSRMADLTAEELDGLRLGSGPYLLIEAPLEQAAGDFDMLLARIRGRGEEILLAHPERSPLFQREPERLMRLVQEGVLCSVTAGSITGRFGASVRELTLELLRAELVHNVASDSHDPERRPPGLGEALRAAELAIDGVAGQAAWLTRLAPAAIITGQPLPPKPALV